MKKAITKKDLAKKFGIHIETLNKWLREVPDLQLNPKQRIFTPKQIKLIFEYLGDPDSK